MTYEIFTDYRVGRDEILQSLKDQKTASAKARAQMLKDMRRVSREALSVRKVMGGILGAAAVRRR